jgi:hypothetical protein
MSSFFIPGRSQRRCTASGVSRTSTAGIQSGCSKAVATPRGVLAIGLAMGIWPATGDGDGVRRGAEGGKVDGNAFD